MSRIIQYVNGKDTLGVRADDSFWLTNATQTWKGTLVAGTHARLERLLLAAGFPDVPAHPIPAGSAPLTLFYEDASASLAWNANDLFVSLFQALDTIADAARRGLVRGELASVALQDPTHPSPTEKLFADMFTPNAPRRPSPKQRAKLDDALARGRALIGLPDPSAAPKDVARAVAGVVDRLRAEKRGDDPTFIALGVVFGDALARATGWGWSMLEAVPALLPENRAHVVHPIQVVIDQVRSERAPTLMLLFAMIASGQLPPSKDGALTELR